MGHTTKDCRIKPVKEKWVPKQKQPIQVVPRAQNDDDVRQDKVAHIEENKQKEQVEIEVDQEGFERLSSPLELELHIILQLIQAFTSNSSFHDGG